MQSCTLIGGDEIWLEHRFQSFKVNICILILQAQLGSTQPCHHGWDAYCGRLNVRSNRRVRSKESSLMECLSRMPQKWQVRFLGEENWQQFNLPDVIPTNTTNTTNQETKSNLLKDVLIKRRSGPVQLDTLSSPFRLPNLNYVFNTWVWFTQALLFQAFSVPPYFVSDGLYMF